VKLLCAAFLLAASAYAAPRILLGYLDNWTSSYSISDVEKGGAAKHLTHLAYAFANVHAGACRLSDPQTDSSNFAALLALRQHYPKLKILISVGGADAANTAAFAAAAKTREGRAKLAASCLHLFSSFDGIDLDWEYPAATDKSNFTALVSEFRTQLNSTGRRYLLTIAAPAGKQNYSQLELAKVAAQLDFLNLMTYNYAGNWSNRTGHAAPLSSIAATVKDYRDAGVSPAKIVLGIPFFGPGWTGVAPTNHGLFQSPSTPAGHAAFHTLHKLPGFASFNDRESGAHWIYNQRTRAFWSFDDQRTVVQKVRYLKSQGLGGAMVWSLKDDTPNASLVKAIASALK
jgi:chitinase